MIFNIDMSYIYIFLFENTTCKRSLKLDECIHILNDRVNFVVIIGKI